tara:strand:+ start:110 stop:490 length:381 start_codon:yes stop_codon:yes gene_type:complete
MTKFSSPFMAKNPLNQHKDKPTIGKDTFFGTNKNDPYIGGNRPERFNREEGLEWSDKSKDFWSNKNSNIFPLIKHVNLPVRATMAGVEKIVDAVSYPFRKPGEFKEKLLEKFGYPSHQIKSPSKNK